MRLPDELQAKIEANPWAVVGAAALVGAFVGFAPLRAKPDKGSSIKRWAADALLSAVSAIALKYLKDAGIEHLGTMARQWLGGDEAAEGSEVAADREANGRGQHRSRERGHA